MLRSRSSMPASCSWCDGCCELWRRRRVTDGTNVDGDDYEHNHNHHKFSRGVWY